MSGEGFEGTLSPRKYGNQTEMSPTSKGVPTSVGDQPPLVYTQEQVEYSTVKEGKTSTNQ